MILDLTARVPMRDSTALRLNGGSGVEELFQILTGGVQDDYSICQRWKGDTSGTWDDNGEAGYLVLRQPCLRTSLHEPPSSGTPNKRTVSPKIMHGVASEVLYDKGLVTYAYDSTDPYYKYQRRVASWGGGYTQDEIITPPYYVGQLLTAIRARGYFVTSGDVLQVVCYQENHPRMWAVPRSTELVLSPG